MTTGLLASVSDLKAIDTVATVYNFEVANTHTYYVGTEGVLVHNQCGVGALSQIKTALSVEEWRVFQDLLINARATTAERLIFYKELAKLDNPTLKAFFNDFKAGDLAFQRGIILSSELVSEWKSITVLSTFARDLDFLKKIKELRGGYAETHIFAGHTVTNSAGVIVDIKGVHHFEALTTKTGGFISGDIRIRPGTEIVNASTEVFEGIVEIFDGTNWIRKSANGGISTFFPRNWTRQKTFEEISYISSRRPAVRATSPGAGGNQFTALSSDRLITIDYYQGTTQVISCFPIF